MSNLLAAGTSVQHKYFGQGTITGVEGEPHSQRYVIKMKGGDIQRCRVGSFSEWFTVVPEETEAQPVPQPKLPSTKPYVPTTKAPPKPVPATPASITVKSNRARQRVIDRLQTPTPQAKKPVVEPPKIKPMPLARDDGLPNAERGKSPAEIAQILAENKLALKKVGGLRAPPKLPKRK